ncbi:MAG TPA: diacylglycerol kinase family protein [Candidatus Paceibacterota bacterium]|nr:diacylglycerol kinase family protein [Candidatus Paceibacterota bacterium]
METKKEKKKFSVIARVRSTDNALRGIKILLKTGHNFWVHVFFAVLAIYLGVILHISSTEWVLIVLAISLVVIAEAFNTAIEVDIDLTSPGYHPYARDAKDISAGAVALAVIAAGIIGLIVFLPKIFLLII